MKYWRSIETVTCVGFCDKSLLHKQQLAIVKRSQLNSESRAISETVLISVLW